jgi:hypothetical protein
MEAIKKCSKCDIEKEISQFRRDKNTKDGRRSACKDCTNIFDSIYRKNMTSEQRKKSHENHRKTHKKQIHEYLRKFRKDNPQIYRAWEQVNSAVKRGKIVREPCEICGEENSHAHHEDYLKPFEIQWLCPLHHKEKHTASKALSGVR